MSGFNKFNLFGIILLVLAIVISPQFAVAPVLAASSPTPTHNGSITVKEAVNRGLIRLTLTANGELFYHSPLHYLVENLTSNPLQIEFPVGQLFIPDDIAYQAFVLANTVNLGLNLGQVLPNQIVAVDLNLAPNQSVEGNLPVFCTNESRHSPSAGITYTLGKMAQGDLLKLAQVIESQSAQGHLGAQLAVWALTDKLAFNDFNATQSPGQPSLVDSIRPVLCLAQDEINLGQQLLVDSQVSERLYTGENPITTYCQSQGIPAISQIEQQAKTLGERALLLIGLGACGCVIVIIGVVLLAIRLFRKRK